MLLLFLAEEGICSNLWYGIDGYNYNKQITNNFSALQSNSFSWLFTNKLPVLPNKDMLKSQILGWLFSLLQCGAKMSISLRTEYLRVQ